MPGGVFRYLDLVGTSNKSIEEAIGAAIAEATKSSGKIHWFEVTETRGRVENGAVAEYQVGVRVGVRAE